MEDIYIPPMVKDLKNFYGDLLTSRSQFSSIKEHLLSLSAKMWEGIKDNVSCVKMELNNYHPDYLGLPLESPIWRKLNQLDCQQAIASEYGFKDWSQIEELSKTKYDEDLQSAIDTLLNGDQKSLEVALDKNPDLINQPTKYGHKARLIHYCSSNGVEMWRQVVPYNLPQMINLLIEKGVDRITTMNIYGGQHDVLSLAQSSIHPYDAGIDHALLEALKC